MQQFFLFSFFIFFLIILCLSSFCLPQKAFPVGLGGFPEQG